MSVYIVVIDNQLLNLKITIVIVKVLVILIVLDMCEIYIIHVVYVSGSVVYTCLFILEE